MTEKGRSEPKQELALLQHPCLTAVKPAHTGPTVLFFFFAGQPTLNLRGFALYLQDDIIRIQAGEIFESIQNEVKKGRFMVREA